MTTTINKTARTGGIIYFIIIAAGMYRNICSFETHRVA